MLPVYNELEILEQVVEEWLPVLTRATKDLSVCILDDGSTDGTSAVAERLAARHPWVETVRKPNTGHGRTCLHGYRLACERGARLVLQIDSDGQCDPSSFERLWALRHESRVVLGYRKVREDGQVRSWVSRLTAVGVLAATGVWTRDPNVPYRLMRTEILTDLVADTPDDVDLVNVYLTPALVCRSEVRWVDITFRQRWAGHSHHNLPGIVRRGAAVLRQLARDRRFVRQSQVEASDGPRTRKTVMPSAEKTS